MLAVCWLCCSYSYSEIINAQSKNAAVAGLNWTMTNILPQAAGLTVGAVSYTYTANKLPNDPLLVTVSNKHTQQSGYIFRSQDDWTGLAGNTITKTIGVNNIPGTYWGSGSITKEGIGSIEDPRVTYSYKYDTCAGTTSTDPTCPNYRAPKQFSPDYSSNEDFVGNYNVWNYEENSAGALQAALKAEQTKSSQQLKKSAINSLANTQIAALLFAQNNYFNVPAYSATVPGGAYPEVVVLKDSKLPDSRNGARLSFSQELLHTRMVDQQFIKRNPK